MDLGVKRGKGSNTTVVLCPLLGGKETVKTKKAGRASHQQGSALLAVTAESQNENKCKKFNVSNGGSQAQEEFLNLKGKLKESGASIAGFQGLEMDPMLPTP